ncbi:hypothetical protein D9613_005110 [Agrocybe pediades]|uniref:Yeast cell wall synthesis Kre9/Knh1-like N-terminal domain-containing protein n=1 Tax=Agrocybe pediades TaxID=84607 RepID=A0A8H4QZU0_9AGAR|nr:hypothetical protein D9613_005110 [Agrocybe pediades]KAF9568933.1 hypothetical protein CPC08DRAFT_678487 [Agrocybe pediades]
MHSVAVLFAFVSSAFAYQVLVPNGVQGWTNQGAQPLKWDMVSTDRQNFTAVLTNQAVQGFDTQVLKALVNGTLGETTVNPPSGGWPVGEHFRVNLVQDANNLNTILAQSPEFTIKEAPVSSQSSSSTGSPTNTSPANTPTDNSGSNAGGNTAGSGTTEPITVPTGAGVSDFAVPTGLLAFFSLMGIILA